MRDISMEFEHAELEDILVVALAIRLGLDFEDLHGRCKLVADGSRLTIVGTLPENVFFPREDRLVHSRAWRGITGTDN